MCGLAGYINFSGEPTDIKTIRRMTDALIHRGPDGSGYWQGDGVGLGHRRLSIIDLREIAGQPTHSANERFIMVYNGEIYNFRDIRSDLIARGHSFRTDGDSEVLLAAYVEWGVEAFSRLNGMFAVAIYDRKEKEIVLARDRYGVKPLYYQLRDGVLAFASEAKAIFQHAGFKPRLNSKGLAEYMHFMNFLSDQTLFDGLRMLPAGSYAKVACGKPQPNNAALQTTSYWDFRFSGNQVDFDSSEIADKVYDLFSQAVKRQMVSDVGVSAFLSGGVDSGSITAIAAGEVDLLRTFTAGFDTPNSGKDSHFDERDAAEHMAREFRTSHFEVFVKADDLERTLEKLCFHLDEPRVGQSYPNFLVSELAGKFEKVVLSGCGGDEMFGGYPWRYFHGSMKGNFEDYIDSYYKYWRRLIRSDAEFNQAFLPIIGEVSDFDGRALFASIYPDEAKSAQTTEELLNWSLYFEAKTFLHGLLVVEDKVAMAHSLETRVPFLDNDLVDYACTVPIQAKLAHFGSNGLDTSLDPRSGGKAILRQMMARLVPEEVHQRKKLGFSAPDASWFKNDSYPFIEAKLMSKSRRINDIINPKYISNILAQHKGATANNRLQIWALLHLSELMETYSL